MSELERHLQQRFPHWFRGRRARVALPVLRHVARWSRFDAIEAFLERSAGLRGFAFVEAAMAFVGLRYELDPDDLRRIPASGRLLVVANHPSGALDALALLDAIGRVRRDVRIVANDLLSAIEPLSGLLLPLRVFGGGVEGKNLHAVTEALEREQCVIVFPAGEVSALGMRGVRDGRWRRGFVRFARASGAPVLPARIVARNSPLFYGASAVYRPAATFLLAREMFARRARPLRLRFGDALPIGAAESDEQAIRRVRGSVYALSRGAASSPGPEPIASPVDADALLAHVAQTRLLGTTSDGMQIRLARCVLDAPLLQEIGRLREQAFRAVGEGTGRSRDLDAFDAHYEHILVWDAERSRIAGAYRVMHGSRALATQGLAALYTAALFRYSDDAIPRIAQGMELGRSFVSPEYQGSRSLDYLWQGIGAYLAAHPGVRYLFGPVSISAALPRAAREQLVAYYQQYHGCERALAASRRPFRYFAAPPSFGELDAGTAFDVLRQNLGALGTSVPVLYRQYIDLCEPGGARFLAFGVDPAFSDAIDGLIEVDLHCLRAHKRKRYLRHGVVPA